MDSGFARQWICDFCLHDRLPVIWSEWYLVGRFPEEPQPDSGCPIFVRPNRGCGHWRGFTFRRFSQCDIHVGGSFLPRIVEPDAPGFGSSHGAAVRGLWVRNYWWHGHFWRPDRYIDREFTHWRIPIQENRS